MLDPNPEIRRDPAPDTLTTPQPGPSQSEQAHPFAALLRPIDYHAGAALLAAQAHTQAAEGPVGSLSQTLGAALAQTQAFAEGESQALSASLESAVSHPATQSQAPTPATGLESPVSQPATQAPTPATGLESPVSHPATQAPTPATGLESPVSHPATQAPTPASGLESPVSQPATQAPTPASGLESPVSQPATQAPTPATGLESPVSHPATQAPTPATGLESPVSHPATQAPTPATGLESPVSHPATQAPTPASGLESPVSQPATQTPTPASALEAPISQTATGPRPQGPAADGAKQRARIRSGAAEAHLRARARVDAGESSLAPLGPLSLTITGADVPVPAFTPLPSAATALSGLGAPLKAVVPRAGQDMEAAGVAMRAFHAARQRSEQRAQAHAAQAARGVQTQQEAAISRTRGESRRRRLKMSRLGALMAGQAATQADALHGKHKKISKAREDAGEMAAEGAVKRSRVEADDKRRKARASAAAIERDAQRRAAQKDPEKGEDPGAEVRKAQAEISNLVAEADRLAQAILQAGLSESQAELEALEQELDELLASLEDEIDRVLAWIEAEIPALAEQLEQELGALMESTAHDLRAMHQAAEAGERQWLQQERAALGVTLQMQLSEAQRALEYPALVAERVLTLENAALRGILLSEDALQDPLMRELVADEAFMQGIQTFDTPDFDGDPRHKPTTSTPEEATLWALSRLGANNKNNCRGFVQDAYWHRYNNPVHGGQSELARWTTNNSALDSWHLFEANQEAHRGAVVPLESGADLRIALPQGTVVFFGDEHPGHVAIATGTTDEAGNPILVTTFYGAGDENSLATLQDISDTSGEAVGYVLPKALGDG